MRISIGGVPASANAASAALSKAGLVYLVGPGGVGKTCTAVQIASRLAGAGWYRFIDLASCRDESQLLEALADAFAIHLKPADDASKLARLLSALSQRGVGTAVFDNLEQLGAAALGLLKGLAAPCGQLRAIATSRLHLDAGNCTLVELDPLAPSSATRLFELRAQAAGVALAPSDRPIVEEIVEALDRIPISIEIAAGRLAIMTLQQLNQRLSRDHGADAAGQRSGGAQRHVMRSWSLLSDEQRRAVMVCASFHGGFTLESAHALLGSEDESTTLDVLEDLRRHSLLWRSTSADGAMSRLHVVASVRDHARRRMSEPSALSLARRHAEHYATHAERWLTESDVGTRATTIDAVGCEQRNLEAAFDATAPSAPEQAASIALALDIVLTVRSSPAHHVAFLERAHSLEVGQPLACRLALALGRAERRAGRLSQATAVLDLAEREAPASAGVWVARIVQTLGRLAVIEGRRDDAMETYGRALRLAEDNADPLSQLRVWRDLADVEDDPELARRALSVATRLDDPIERAFAHWILARRLRVRDHFTEARAHFDAALTLSRGVGDRYLETVTLASLARLHHQSGALANALESYQAALSMHRQSGNTLMARWLLTEVGSVQHALGLLDAATQSLSDALQQCRESDDRFMETFALAHLALVVMRDDRGEADAMLAQAQMSSEGHADPDQQALAAAVRAVRSAASAALDGDLDAALTLRWPGSDRDVCVATWVQIARSLRADEGSSAVKAPAAEPPVTSASLILQVSEAWFDVGEGPVTIGEDSPLMRILLTLAQQHRRLPGAACSRSHLISVGWPGETISAKASFNRLRNAVARLRSMGLRDEIVTRSDGYQLLQSIIVRLR